MDFLEDPEAEEFVMEWNQEVFEEGKVGLEEGEFLSLSEILGVGWRFYEKKLGLIWFYVLAFVFIMLAFCLWNHRICRVGIFCSFSLYFWLCLRSFKHVCNLYSS